MRIHWLGIALLAAQAAAFAQMDSNTLTVTATRPLNLQPDQAVLGAYVYTPEDVGLDQVSAALSGTGITSANLVSVYTQPGTQPIGSTPHVTPTVQWTFSLTVPFSKMNETLASLATAQQGIGTGWSLTSFVQGAQVSAALRAAEPCALPALVSDARAHAQQVAAAAGVSVGAIVALSEPGGVYQWTSSERTGDFSGVLGSVPTLGLASFLVASAPVFSSPAQNCTLTVQFQLRP